MRCRSTGSLHLIGASGRDDYELIRRFYTFEWSWRGITDFLLGWHLSVLFAVLYLETCFTRISGLGCW